MDRILAGRLNALMEQSKRLKAIEEAYLSLESSKKSMLAQLTTTAPGKSHAERETIALASQDWARFTKGLVTSEAQFNYEKRKWDILNMAFYAELNTYKQEAKDISKHSFMP